MRLCLGACVLLGALALARSGSADADLERRLRIAEARSEWLEAHAAWLSANSEYVESRIFLLEGCVSWLRKGPGAIPDAVDAAYRQAEEPVKGARKAYYEAAEAAWKEATRLKKAYRALAGQ